MSGRTVMETPDRLFSERARRRYVRSDYGAEFRKEKLADWLSQMGVTPMYSDPRWFQNAQGGEPALNT